MTEETISEAVPKTQDKFTAYFIAFIILMMVGISSLIVAGGGDPASARLPQTGNLGLATDGSPINLQDHKGEVVALFFWATWCAPCMKKMPEVNRLSTAYADKGVRFIGISADTRASDLQRYLTQNPTSFPVIFDQTGTITRNFGAPALSSVVLLNREGNIARVSGPGDDLEKSLAGLL